MKEFELSILSVIAIGVFICIWLLYYLSVILRAISIIGLRKYFSMVVSRDFRVWEGFYNILILAILFIGPAVGINISLRVKLIIIFVLVTPSLKGFLPPQILLLHSFDNLNYNFARKLVKSRVGVVSSLAPGMENPIHIFRNVIKSHWGFGTKYGSEKKWRKVVEKYIELAEVIIMDLSSAGKGLIEEMHILSQKPDQIKKLIIVYRNEDVAQKGFEALPGPLKNNCPIYPYGKEMESEYIGEKIKKQIFSTGKYLMPMWLKSSLALLIFIVFLYEVFQHT